MIFPMKRREVATLLASTAALAVLAGLPLADDGFWLALGISIASYVAMATAWALFSGPTNYVSLATAAFFGSGAYVVSSLAESAPWPAVLAAAWHASCRTTPRAVVLQCRSLPRTAQSRLIETVTTEHAADRVAHDVLCQQALGTGFVA